MFKEERCVEYYFDSKNYNEEKIIENIKEEEKGFEKEKSDISIKLNEYGIYEVKVKFLSKKAFAIKNKIIEKMDNRKAKAKPKPKLRKTYKGYETYDENNRVYGEYKTTKTYQPI